MVLELSLEEQWLEYLENAWFFMCDSNKNIQGDDRDGYMLNCKYTHANLNTKHTQHQFL